MPRLYRQALIGRLRANAAHRRNRAYAQLFAGKGFGKGLGSGVHELVEDHRGDAYRAIYMVRIAGRVHVLHAFQKKSKSGIKTPRTDVELVETRLKAVLERYRNERE